MDIDESFCGDPGNPRLFSSFSAASKAMVNSDGSLGRFAGRVARQRLKAPGLDPLFDSIGALSNPKGSLCSEPFGVLFFFMNLFNLFVCIGVLSYHVLSTSLVFFNVR